MAPRGRATQLSQDTRKTKKAEQSALSLSFPIKMMTKLEWTQSSAQQHIEQYKNAYNCFKGRKYYYMYQRPKANTCQRLNLPNLRPFGMFSELSQVNLSTQMKGVRNIDYTGLEGKPR